jgi:hypothetical protein
MQDMAKVYIWRVGWLEDSRDIAKSTRMDAHHFI